MTVLNTYRSLEARLIELSPDSRERLLYQLVGAIATNQSVSVTALNETISSYEKSAREW